MAEVVVGPDDAGARLDVVVARALDVSRAVAARLIASGDVSVDGRPAAKSLVVETGMRIVAAAPAAPPPLEAEAIEVRTVYEDDVLLVISKPAGLVVHPAPGHESGTLVNALVERGAAGGDPERPGIVHRLDAGTSGLMIVAKDPAAYDVLSAAMAAREVSRAYLALVEGRPATDTLTIDAPIGRSPRHRKKMAVVAGGRDAVTDVTVLERHEGSSLVEARPYTGRTHQIRVHLEAAGHAVLGDPVYGHERARAKQLGLDRPFLHAARLRFAHPVSGEHLELEEPLPEDLVRALARARGEAAAPG